MLHAKYFPIKACTPGNVHLVGLLSSATQGTVEVCVGGTWGTVCDDSWRLNEAIVVCNQLGYQGTSVAHINAYFGQSNETTLLSGVACTGVEPSLFTCLHNVGSNICPQSRDAGVNCLSGKFYLHLVITLVHISLLVVHPLPWNDWMLMEQIFM